MSCELLELGRESAALSGSFLEVEIGLLSLRSSERVLGIVVVEQHRRHLLGQTTTVRFVLFLVLLVVLVLICWVSDVGNSSSSRIIDIVIVSCSTSFLVKLPERIKNEIELLQCNIDILEVGQPVFIDRVTFVGIINSKSDSFGEFEGLGSFDIDYSFERNGNLDTFSLILTPEDYFLDRLYPFVTTSLTVGAEMPSLVVRGDFEVMSVVRRGFDGNAVVKIDVAVREVRIS